MMPETVRELAAGNRVSLVRLLEMEFASRTVRFWDGVRTLTAGGHDWEGSGGLISMSGLEQAEGFGAGKATFVLAGTTPELKAAAGNAENEVKYRPIRVFIQFLSSRYVPLDVPQAIWAGRMDTISYKSDLRTEQLSLTAESLFVDRARAPWGMQTDPDQQARWPGDLGYSFMPSLRYKRETWLRS